MKQSMRHLPPVHQLQNDERFKALMNTFQIDRKTFTTLIQEQMDLLRKNILHRTNLGPEKSRVDYINLIYQKVEQACLDLTSYYLKRIINATGTILHTNLGRARLSEKAIKHAVEIAGHYTNLEYKITEGTRGSRHDIVENLLKRLTGSESAMVVNNNAAAVYLILRTFSNNKEAIVSRGQLIEIGGSFRISAIMEESGAKLVEVGTTNKTHLYDYENAISDQTAIIMKVHTSNFKTIGFTETVETEELVNLTKQYENIIYYEDLGSGVFFDFKKYGIGDEPVVKEVLKKGPDLISFSGDKLLGGPQAGIIVGKKELIQKLKKHQLARVLRVDKMTLAALEGTLLSYMNESTAINEIPTIRDIHCPLEKIEEKALKFMELLSQNSNQYHLTIEKELSQIGGGTMPDVVLPTYAVLISHELISAESITYQLRNRNPSIIARIKQNHVLFDFRTIQEDEIDYLVSAMVEIE